MFDASRLQGMPDSAAMRRELSRRACARSLAEFARQAWHVIEPTTPLKWGWALDAICEHLEAVTHGDVKRLLINVPPGMAKSVIVGVMWPAWEWGPCGFSSMRYLGTAHKQELAIRDSMKCRRLIQSEWFQARWPIILTGDQNAKTKFENMQTGFREAMAFGSLTGSRGDRCLIGSTIIQTSDGPVCIKDIVMSTKPCYVLGYDERARQIVYRRIEAVARRAKEGVYKLHTSSGRMAICTGSHRWYTERGYVETRLISKGDNLLCAVLETDYQNGCRGKETRVRAFCNSLLRTVLFNYSDKYKAWKAWPILQCLQRKSSEKGWFSPVFGRMQGNSCRAVENNSIQSADKFTRPSMPAMRFSYAAKVARVYSEILLNGLQKCRALFENVWQWEPCLAGWCKQEKKGAKRSDRIFENEAFGFGQRFAHLSGVPFVRRIASASYRHDSFKQLHDEYGNALQSVSYEVPRGGKVKAESDTVALVEDLCRDEVVYDIQVEGTRNFFANGILSHNCLLDDPLSADDANSEAALKSAELTFLEAVPTRINNEDSAIIVIMQRLHQKDTSGIILSRELGYTHLMLPMEFEPERRCVTSIGFEDPRKEDGELIFPERFGREQVEELKRTMGSHAAAGQLQQRPSPREGAMFKRQWFDGMIIDKAPDGVTWVRHWDLAASKASKSARTAGVKIGKTQDGKFIVGDVILLMDDGAAVRRLIKSTAEIDGYDVLVSLPQDPGQSGKVQAADYATIMAGHRFTAAPESGDKATRAEPFAAQCEAGNVSLVRGPWNDAYLSELMAFPSAAFKDQVDASSGAFGRLVLKKASLFIGSD